MTSLTIRNASTWGDESWVDIVVDDGVIVAMLPTGSASGESLDARGGLVIPGLTDHHIHLFATAAGRESIDCSTAADRDAFSSLLASAASRRQGWVRAVGYSDIAHGPLDRRDLDSIISDLPVRVQHDSGALWVLNSVALAIAGADAAAHPGIERDAQGRATGRLWRADEWLRSAAPSASWPDLGSLSAELSALGVTAVTDASPDLSREAISSLQSSVDRGVLAQRLTILGAPCGWMSTGQPGGITAGPLKIVLADSGLPSLGDLVERIAATHRHGRAVAVHSVTIESLVLLLAAIEIAGPMAGDRVEHASLVPEALIDELARLGVRVVTQPGFLVARGERYRNHVEESDLPGLYRVGSLMRAGVPVSFSSDAPYGPLDPWLAMRAAVSRTTAASVVVASEERISPEGALRAFMPTVDGGSREPLLGRGDIADLVILRSGHFSEALQMDSPVAATLIDGIVQ